MDNRFEPENPMDIKTLAGVPFDPDDEIIWNGLEMIGYLIKDAIDKQHE